MLWISAFKLFAINNDSASNSGADVKYTTLYSSSTEADLD